MFAAAKRGRVSVGLGGGVVQTGRVVSLSRNARGTLVALRPRQVQEVHCKAVPSDVADNPNAAWVHLTTFGEWKGHPAGEFAFNNEVFGQLVRNFEAQKTPVAFKYEHPSYELATGPVPSAGKIYDLKVNADGLWAFTLFTDRAAKHIRAKEYEFCSVVVRFDSKSAVTGEDIGAELLEVGLTDGPFIDGQHPIRLPDLGEAEAA